MILNIIVIGILLVIILPYTLYKMYGTNNLISTKEYLILSIIIVLLGSFLMFNL